MCAPRPVEDIRYTAVPNPVAVAEAEKSQDSEPLFA